MSGAAKLTCLSCGQINRVPLDKIDAGPKCAVCGVALCGGGVATLDLSIHNKATRSDELALIVDYWAPWCGPCKMMAPEFAKAAPALRGRARFAKIDTQQFPVVSQNLRIKGIPLLILYLKGREVARLSGARPAHEIDTFVRQQI